MKRIMFIVCAAFTLCGAKVCGQSGKIQYVEEVKYTYDGAGNRISREIVLVPTGKGTTNGSEEQDIQVYPNPVRDELTVEIWQGDDEENYHFRLFNMSGMMIKESNQQGNGIYFVDMSMFLNGTYIFIIDYEGDSREFIITKSEL